MRNMILAAVFIIVAVGILATLFLVNKDASVTQQSSSDGFTVVATTGMIADMVRRIADPEVTVTALMGPGVDPHLFKASEGDVQRMMNARIIFYNGLHLEGKLTEVFEQMDKRGVSTVAVSRELPVSRLLNVAGFTDVKDPHIWFDVGLWLEASKTVEAVLMEARPEAADIIASNGRDYRKQLALLHAEVKQDVARIPDAVRVLVTAHDAFGYFAEAYNIEVRAIQGVSTSTEAGARDIKELADFLAARQIPAVFVESSVPPQTIRALQEAVRSRGFELAIGGELYSDAMGPTGSGADSYMSMVRHNVTTIVNSLAHE